MVRSWTKSLLETRRCGPQARRREVECSGTSTHRHSPVSFFINLIFGTSTDLPSAVERCSLLEDVRGCPRRLRVARSARLLSLDMLLLPFIYHGDPDTASVEEAQLEYPEVSMLDGGSSMAGVRDACEEGPASAVGLAPGVSRFVIFRPGRFGTVVHPGPTGVWKTRRM